MSNNTLTGQILTKNTPALTGQIAWIAQEETLLQETGDNLLLETGDYLLLE